MLEAVASRSTPLVLLLPLLPRLLGAGRALLGRLEHLPLHGGDALLEARHARPRERRRGGERWLDAVERARDRVVVDSWAETARQQQTTPTEVPWN